MTIRYMEMHRDNIHAVFMVVARLRDRARNARVDHIGQCSRIPKPAWCEVTVQWGGTSGMYQLDVSF